ncbi:MAG: tetratricopeptide repeat protein [Myxococcota bacterium]
MFWLILGCGGPSAPPPPDPDACFSEAQRLLTATPGDPAARAPLDCACDGGRPIACTTLAAWARDGTNQDPNLLQAAELFERACDLGDGWGCASLGLAYLEGRGVTVDTDRGLALQIQGCEVPKMASAKGCSNAGKNLLTGRWGTQDPLRAVALLERGCKLQDETSCMQLQIAKRPDAYIEAMRPLCASGDLKSCGNLGSMLPLGSEERDEALNKACAGGISLACRTLEAAAGNQAVKAAP